MTDNFSAYAYIIKDNGELYTRKKLCITKDHVYAHAEDEAKWKETDDYKNMINPSKRDIHISFNKYLKNNCKTYYRSVIIPRPIDGKTAHLVVFDSNKNIVISKRAKCFHHNCVCPQMMVIFVL